MLFILCFANLAALIKELGLRLHRYADDSQIKGALLPSVVDMCS
jgi:hypothetical protein